MECGETENMALHLLNNNNLCSCTLILAIMYQCLFSYCGKVGIFEKP